MASNNFDFGGNIDADRDVNPQNPSESEETALSVYGLLIAYCGYTRGKCAYDALLRVANKASEQHGGQPGIMFDVEGGRFVAIKPN